MPKRRKVADEDDDGTPRKTRRAQAPQGDQSTPTSLQAQTPSGRKSILRGTPSKVNGVAEGEETPKGLKRVLFSTPSKPAGEIEEDDQETPTATRNDRSARRKSARALHSRSVGDGSEDEDNEREFVLAQEILEDNALEEESEDDAEASVPSSAATTPSKKRGRPKGKRRERTPSPPPELPPHELYFFQNRTGANKTSANTFPANLLQNHEDYLKHIKTYKDPHEQHVKRLKHYHKRAFDQWMFEMDEGFNLCLYGYGSKRQLAMDFAEHMCIQADKPPNIVVINGYAPGLLIRDVLTPLASIALPKDTKLPAQPTALMDLILSTLTEHSPSQPIRLVIHSLDHSNLRKTGTQALIARLASHEHISILATCDTPNFPILWDTTLIRQFRWLYHDATTFEPYTAEIDVVEDVNALLGRSSRRLGGKDGVGYVLKSLPENARNLFRILVAEQLALVDGEPSATLGAAPEEDDDSILGASDEEEAAVRQHTPSRRGRGRRPKPKTAAKATNIARPSQPEGIEYRTLYHKAVEEFVCSSELNFRTLLKEFHDHQMIESRKDIAGTERIFVPFRRDELESILEELI